MCLLASPLFPYSQYIFLVDPSASPNNIRISFLKFLFSLFFSIIGLVSIGSKSLSKHFSKSKSLSTFSSGKLSITSFSLLISSMQSSLTSSSISLSCIHSVSFNPSKFLFLNKSFVGISNSPLPNLISNSVMPSATP